MDSQEMTPNATRTWTWRDLWESAYKGVDHTLPGNGGPECVRFITLSQRIVECATFGFIGLVEAYFALRKVKLPRKIKPETSDWVGRRVLLLLMCLTFGAELGFKFATRQLIWVLNPCHVVSMIQIFLLTAPANRFTTAMFRIHMHMLNGAPLAMIFPVINTRLLPCETGVYYIQHILILLIPYFLLKHGGVYTVEPLLDYSWVILTLGFLFVYHFVPLHMLAMVTEVNLNNMLCPAISDPFYGRYYRICAAIHQTMLIMIHGKIYTLLASLVLPLKGRLFPKSTEFVDSECKEERVYGRNFIQSSMENSGSGTCKQPGNNIREPPMEQEGLCSIGEKNGHAKMH